MAIRVSVSTPKPDQVLFFYQLGLATSQWSSVEQILGYVVAECFPRAEAAMAMHGLAAIENFRSKCDYAEAVFQESRHIDAHQAEFKSVINNVRASSRHRNKLAHWHTTYYTLADEIARRTVLVPWMLKDNRESRLSPPTEAIGIRDLEYIRLQFLDTFMRLISLLDKMRGHPEQTPAYPGLPIRPPSIRDLRARMRAALEVPSSPSLAKPSPKEKT